MHGKEKQIINFVKRYTGAFEQRGADWLRARNGTIGGSEISALIGKNRFTKIGDLFLRKVQRSLPRCDNADDEAEYDPNDIDIEINNVLKFGAESATFTGNTYTRWGTLFEPLISQYTAQKYGAKIHGEDIFVYEYGNPVSCSPDGLALINEKITLLEFKCPYMRAISPKVPEYYLPQVLYGMDKIEMCEQALFVQGAYRRCSTEQLLACDKSFNKSPVSHPVRKCENLQSGVFIFYCHREALPMLYDKDDLGISNDADNDYTIPDIGGIDKDLFEKYFNLWTVNARCMVITMDNNDTEMFLTKYHDKTTKITNEGDEVLGILPWKLVRTCDGFVDKQEGYIADHHELIKSFTQDVQQFCNTADFDERFRLLKKYMDPEDDSSSGDDEWY